MRPIPVILSIISVVCSAAVGQTPSAEKLAPLLESYAEQRAMVENLYFETERVDPYRPPIHASSDGNDRRPAIPEPLKGFSLRSDTKYQVDLAGRFRHEQRRYKVNDATGDSVMEARPQYVSFDGQLYHSLRYSQKSDGTYSGMGTIFTPEFDFNVVGPEIKAPFFMDHIFNEDLVPFLTASDIQVLEQADGTWKVARESTPDDAKIKELTVRPDMNFMITEIRGFWSPGLDFSKTVKHKRLSNGFYHPEQGVLQLSGLMRATLDIKSFELNADDSHGYEFPIPPGIHIDDYSTGVRKTYYTKTADASN